MKILNAMAALVVCATLFLPVCVFAQDMPIQAVSAISTFGTVAEIGTEDRPFILINTEYPEMPQLFLNVSDQTVCLDNTTGLPCNISDIKTGDSILAYFSPAITKSIPPQSSAFAIITNVDKEKTMARFITVGSVETSKDGIWVISHDQQYRLNINDKTEILPYKTKAAASLESIKPGTRLFAWFDIMTLSIPALASPTRVVILPELVIDVNGQVLTGYPVEFIDGGYMVPVRAVASILGFEVGWDGESGTVFLDSDPLNISFSVDSTSYFFTGSLVNQSFNLPGAKLIDGKTYVPLELLVLIYGQEDIVTMTESTIKITTP